MAAASTAQQLEEIESALLHLPGAPPPPPLDPHHHRSSAYAALLQLMHRCASQDHPPEGTSGLQSLSLHCPSLLPVIFSDISLPDEETCWFLRAALALKCLGFMVYHPVLSPAIPGSIANQVVESLTRLVVTTRMKAICNLGVWCISVQQLDASALGSHVHSLLQAVVHALDNPFGSLSTTLEATQAVVKLVTQLCEKMKEMSDIWAPPIYRRLLSVDKKERDVSERCLLKIKSVLLPPPLKLSKAVAVDLKQKLLPRMMGMLEGHGEEVQAVKAWGWYIHLLGSYALRNRLLINELLKIPEKAFTDTDPQVNIASLVSWESLVDTLLPFKMVALKMDREHGDGGLKIACSSSTTIRDSEIQVDGLLKRVKLIMVPLVGILSSKCDISVRSTSLNTWHYLLRKLNTSINHPSVKTLVLEPVLEIVFSKGPDSTNIWLWNSCLDLLEELVLSKVYDGRKCLNDVNSCHSLIKASSSGLSAEAKDLWNDHPNKWLPWELNELSFLVKMINYIVCPGAVNTDTRGNEVLVLSAALRIFRSVLKGTRAELKRSSTNYTEIQLCVNTILMFVKNVCENVTSESIYALKGDMLCCTLHILEAISEESETSVLVSSLCRVVLDVKYICELESGKYVEYLRIPGIAPLAYMDMVSPLVFLEILYLSVMAQSMLHLSEPTLVLQKTQLLEFVLFSSNPMVTLHAFICFLYMHCQKLSSSWLSLLSLWKVVAQSLQEHINAVNGLDFLKTETNNDGYNMIYLFLWYPFVCVTSMGFLGPVKADSEFCLVFSEKQIEFESVIESWKSLFCVANHVSQLESSHMNNFIEGLSELLIRVLDENVSILQGSVCFTSMESTQKYFSLSLYGEVVSYMLKEIRVLDHATLAAVGNQESSECIQESHLKNILVLVSRFLLLLVAVVKINPMAEFSFIKRIFDALSHLVGRICLKLDIVLLMKTISDPLAHWLTSCAHFCTEMQQAYIPSQLHLFWKQLLDCLLKTRPPILFDSSFLKVQATLLQAALDNQYPPISQSTVAFWKATYGKQINLHYPQCLLPVLEKLSRNGLIKLHKEHYAMLKDINSSVGKTTGVSQRCKVSATKMRITKMIEFVESMGNSHRRIGDPLLGLRKKRLKLQQHSAYASGMLQDVSADCHALVPGADVDISEGFHHPEEKQNLRQPGCILKMLRKGM